MGAEYLEQLILFIDCPRRTRVTLLTPGALENLVAPGIQLVHGLLVVPVNFLCINKVYRVGWRERAGMLGIRTLGLENEGCF